MFYKKVDTFYKKHWATFDFEKGTRVRAKQEDMGSVRSKKLESEVLKQREGGVGKKGNEGLSQSGTRPGLTGECRLHIMRGGKVTDMNRKHS